MSYLIQTKRRSSAPKIPWVSILIIVICVSLTLALSFILAEPQNWLQRWAFLPYAWQQDSGPFDLQILMRYGINAVTAIFLHVEWLHLAVNMAYLLVFGWAVEKRLGHFTYLLLFLISGIFVNLLLYLVFSSDISADLQGYNALPVIGASGSVSAIIGCYLALFPGGRIGVYLPLGIFPQFVRVPSILVIGSWVLLQIVYTMQGAISSTLAWKIHLSGFVIGLSMALLLRIFSVRV